MLDWTVFLITYVAVHDVVWVSNLSYVPAGNQVGFQAQPVLIAIRINRDAGSRYQHNPLLLGHHAEHLRGCFHEVDIRGRFKCNVTTEEVICLNLGAYLFSLADERVDCFNLSSRSKLRCNRNLAQATSLEDCQRLEPGR